MEAIKSTPTLGELNPLINKIDLERSDLFEILKGVAIGQIIETGGIQPQVFETRIVTTPPPRSLSYPRAIARFETHGLPERKIKLIEELVKKTYGPSAVTRTTSSGREISAINFPEEYDLSRRERRDTNLIGWYMGADTDQVSCLHRGVFVFKEIPVLSKDNFSSDLKPDLDKYDDYVIELREGGDIYQTDFVQMVVQIGSVLGGGKLLPAGSLLEKVYQDLIRKSVKRPEGFNLSHIVDPIMDRLIRPVANPTLRRALGHNPSSVLLCGVYGTGKTAAIEQLIHTDGLGILISPIDPYILAKDLEENPDKQWLLPRIADLRRKTGIPVVPQLDDIDVFAKSGGENNPLLQGLMAGVWQSDFFIIAASNYPEKIERALVEPERFGIRVYCGLPDEKARRKIIELHTPKTSSNLGYELFNPTSLRDLVITHLAEITDGYPPRQLAEITNIAKAILMRKAALLKGSNLGLEEADLSRVQFTAEDWIEAYATVSKSFDKMELAERDDVIRKFVENKRVEAGYRSGSSNGHVGFSKLRSQLSGN